MSAREQVIHLAELVGWVGGGCDWIDWKAVQRSLGLPIPRDFKELVSRFPRGQFQGSIPLAVPERSDDGFEFIGGLELVLEDMRRWRRDEPGRFPYPIYPEKGGLVPWASGSHGETFFWLTDGPDPDRWQVVGCEFSEMLWERFSMSTMQFIHAYVTGGLKSKIFTPKNFGKPTFVAFSDHAKTAARGSDSVQPEFISSIRLPSNEASSLISVADTGHPNPLEWDDVERRLGLHLPSDYKELVDALGPGSFMDLHVVAPDWPLPDYDLFALIERVRAATPQGSMIPWGWTDDGLTFLWDADPVNPNEWNVYIAQPGFFEYRLLLVEDQRLSMTGAVAQYLSDPLSIVPKLVDPRTKTVVDLRILAPLPLFSPAPEES